MKYLIILALYLIATFGFAYRADGAFSAVSVLVFTGIPAGLGLAAGLALAAKRFGIRV